MKRKRHPALIRMWASTALAIGVLVGNGLFMPRTLAVAAAAPVESNEPAVTDGEDAQARPAQEESEVALTNPYEDPTQCTYRAWELAAAAGHRLPRFYNACNWSQAAREYGLPVVDKIGPEAVHGIAVWDSGAGGSSWAGHVGYVTQVDGNRFYVLERNWVTATDTERWVEWEEGISFIILEPPAHEPVSPPAPAAEPKLAIDELALRGATALATAPWSAAPNLAETAKRLLPSEQPELYLTPQAKA